MNLKKPKAPIGFIFPILLAVAAIGFTGWAWFDPAYLKQPEGLVDLSYRALRSVGLGSEFDHTSIEQNWRLEIARWCGLSVAFWAVLSLIYTGLRRTRIRLMVAIRRHHLVVVGATTFADHFSEAAAAMRIEVNHLRPDCELSLRGETIRLPFSTGSPHALASANLGTARRLIIAVADDAEAANLALMAQNAFPNLSISTRMNDPWLARSLHTLPGAEKLRAFTEASSAAREIVRRHLPFLQAQDLGQTRIHSVLVGDHNWLEALIVETILSACTLTYGKPAFTVVCGDAQSFRTRLFQRFPDLTNAAELVFYEGVRDVNAPLSVSQTDDLTQLGPITGVYCAFDDGAASLATASAFRDQVLFEDSFKAPIFVRVDGEGLQRPVAGSRLEPRCLIPFGSLGDIVRASGIMSVHGEQAEKAWHAAYLKFAPNDKTAAVPWDELPEEFRISNQRAVGHIYAKLFEAGFNLRPWLEKHDPWSELPALAKNERLWKDEVQRTRLAELEHERWVADRRMSGWIGGAVRDNVRKVHDNFVPFEELSEELKDYDYQFINLVDKVLKRQRDGLIRE